MKEELHKEIAAGNKNVDETFWQAVIAYEGVLFYTMSGLSFSYMVKRKKNGERSGELLVSRKEGSKTLTKSSVLLAFHKVLEQTASENVAGGTAKDFFPPEYKGPKAIGQIFGISYIYSILWKLNLIQVPEKIEQKLKGE